MPRSTFVQYIGKNLAPRLVYAIGFGLLVLSVLSQFLVNGMKKATENLSISALGLVSSLSSTIIILLGKQGPFAVLIFVSGGILTIQILILWLLLF